MNVMRGYRVVAAAAGLVVGSLAGTAAGSVMFGSLSNFDVINDTGEVCRGFEIELEGVHASDIAFTFGSPYIRYGDPVKEDTATGVIVRYASGYSGGAWAVGTPVPSAPFTTGGHALFYPAYGGDPNYETLGGEHFGIALNGNPINTTYRWLLGDAAGNLVVSGSNARIPAPVWNVNPPANPAAPAAVQAVVPALPKEKPEDLFGEALWVKVFVTELPDPVELDDLLVGKDQVPDGEDVGEVEIEWMLLQAGKDKNDEVDSGEHDLKDGSESESRRYEFYKYIGPYDVEGEALEENPGTVSAGHPNGEFVGEFLGGQNAAINLEAFVIPEPGGLAVVILGACICSRRRRRNGG